MVDNNTDEKKKWKYRRMTDKEIKKLAEDMYKGLIFTDMHIRNSEDIPMVFQPLIFIHEEQLEELRSGPPGLLYEYMSEAGPRSINGMPIFWSFNMLSQEDTKKLFEYYNKIKEAIEKV